MGAGASTADVTQKISAASDEELKGVASQLSEDAKAKLMAALSEEKKATNALPAEPLPSATAMLESIHSKKTSCVAAVEAALARIDATKDLNIVVDILKESALAQAKAVDEKVAAGGELRRLEGLPIVVKANIEGPPGSLVSASTPAMKDFRPATTAPCVEKLLAVRRPSSYS
jgi:hypothetical protein